MPKWFKPKTITTTTPDFNKSSVNSISINSPHLDTLFPKSSSTFSSSGVSIDSNRFRNLNFSKTTPKKTKLNNNNNNNVITISSSSSNIEKSNLVAKSLGFKNTSDFDNFIKNVNPKRIIDVKETKKLTTLFKYLSKIAKKNPKSIAKLAIAGGSITAMIIFLKNFQNDYSGCFRYNKSTNDKIKYKFSGSWCNSNNTKNFNDENIKSLPENEHPLYNQNKWDCKYDSFDKENQQINEILNLGCNGLCDWKNFNILAKTTNGEYKSIFHEEFHKYDYKCETISLLQALSISTTNTLTDLFNVNLGIGIKQIIFLFIILILIYKLYFSLKLRKLKNIALNDYRTK